MTASPAPKPEIIAFASGKGGTGKTLLLSCLGYALVRSGHSVLMIDGDPGTDGLSLFLLGPSGFRQIDGFLPNNTFTGILRRYHQTGVLELEPRAIHRRGQDDHSVSYNALISGRNVYGDQEQTGEILAVPDLDQESFRNAVGALFRELRAGSAFDYILVDTRGGFAFETTDICALADSFIVVTEPDYTSFYQDRNLVRRISAAGTQLNLRPLLRSVIVNKATEGSQQGGALDLQKLEHSFRLEMTKEFPLKFEDTHPVPIDLEAVKAYKTQKIPYLTAPASHFSFATLSAYGEILKVVTSRWSEDRIHKWNELVDQVSAAIGRRNTEVQKEREAEAKRAAELEHLRKQTQEQAQQIEALRREIDRVEKGYEREIERTKLILTTPLKAPPPAEFSGKTGAMKAPYPVPPPPSASPAPQMPASKRSRRPLIIATGLALFILVGTAYWFTNRPSAANPPAPGASSAEKEPNNDLLQANSIPVNTPVAASIDPATDQDAFRFTTAGKARDIFEVLIENRSSTLQPAWRVLDSAKAIVAADSASTPAGDGRYRFAALPGETYYIQISSSYNSTAGAYNLTVKSLNAYDAFEPNDDILRASPIRPESELKANIMDGRDQDFYRFTADVGGNITVSLRNLSTTLQPFLRIFNSMKAEIGMSKANNPGANLVYSFAARPRNEFYIEVAAFSGQGEYYLIIRAVSGTPSTSPGSTRPTIPTR